MSMEESNKIYNEIVIHEDIIEKLKNKYLEITPPCGNVDCSFYTRNRWVENNCTWTWYITTCPDYTPDKEEE